MAPAADGPLGQSGQISPLQIVRAPLEKCVDAECVLDIDEDADRWIDPRQRLDRQNRVEERGAAAAEFVRNLDAHDSEVEQLVDQAAGNLGVLVHLAHQRPDLARGEFRDGTPKQAFLFIEVRERRRHACRRNLFNAHGRPPFLEKDNCVQPEA